MKTRDIISKITGIMIGTTLLFTATPVSAENLHDTLRQQQNQANSLQNEIETVTNQIVELENKISASQREIDVKISEILETVNKIEALEDEILAIEAEIAEKEEEIAKKEEDIAELIANQERRIEILKGRAKALQQQNRTNIVVDIILNSQNFVDLLQRANAVGSLFQSDADIMRELEETQVLIEQEKEALEKKKQGLTDQQNKLTDQQNALEGQKATLEAQQDALEDEQASLKSMQSQKNSSLNTLESNLSQVQGEISSTNARIQEAARLLEQQRAAQAKKESRTNNNSNNTSSNNNSSNNNSNNSGSTGQFNGRFVSPVNGGRITSPFGPRVHPVTGRQSFHKGIDIVSSTPNAPIHAIADGTVVFSGWASGYGNYIVIQHDATTFSGYGHNRTNQVRVGDRVSAGQQIAIMGTTGVSTGVHLHLNIMINTTNFWSGHVDPAPLLGR